MSNRGTKDSRRGEKRHDKDRTRGQNADDRSRGHLTSQTSANQPWPTHRGGGSSQPSGQGPANPALWQERQNQSSYFDQQSQAVLSTQAWSLGGHTDQQMARPVISGPGQPAAQTHVASWIRSVRAATPINPNTATASDVDSFYDGRSYPSRSPTPDYQEPLYILAPGEDIPERRRQRDRENQVITVETRSHRRREERESRRGGKGKGKGKEKERRQH